MAIRRTVAAGLAAASLTLSGCGILSGGVYDAPLPGGADVGDEPITVTADFTDVLDLVPQSSVKVDNVAVGRVTDITLSKDGRTAEVEMLLRGDLDLPGDTEARLQQTSLLGEKYVALVRPEGSVAQASSRRLADGAELSTGSTDAAATAEQVLGALSLVLNGGGIAQFQEISRELQQVGDGRTEEIRAFLVQLNRFVGVLDRKRGAITGAIDGLARLGKSLDGDRAQIAKVLDNLSPGLKVLAEQRPQLTRMLTSLDRLSRITVRTLNASQADMVRDLQLLDPILTQLAKAGSDLPYSMEILLTYPFPDSVLGAIKGDYLNVFMSTNFRTLPSPCAVGIEEKDKCTWPQPTSASVAPGRVSPRTTAPPPLLPPTSSATAGNPSPSVTGPSILPSDRPSSSSSSGSSSSPSGTPSGTPSGSGSTSTPGSSDTASTAGGQ
ncbi:MCE family protein [Nocardioides sp. LML1-1-1.1]|uniref:MCE family protein n=1 Tax=Nocardioides sp. LML1-1-1.1 TaxID=3135248 RepID=UPI003427DB9A